MTVGEVQLLAELVGLCILTHHHGGPGVLGAAVAAGQEFHGDPHELAGHVFAEAVGLRLLGAENSGAQGLQIGLVGEHLRVVRVDHLVRHHALTVSGKVLLGVRTRTGQARIPLDDPVFAGGKVQQGKLQHIIRKDLVGLQCQCGLLTVGDGAPAVTAQQVAAYIPVILAVGLGQQGLGVLHRHGLVEIIALRIQAVGGLQHGDLLRRFHALGDDGQVQAVGHIHHRFHDLHALAAVLLVHVDELHVQLDGVHIGVLEHVQRRIAAAEVVHHHREALAVQALNGVFHQRSIFGQHGLGDLGQQELGLQLIFFHKVGEDLRHIQIDDIHHGNVHGYRHKIAAALLPLVQGLADGFPDVLIQLGHKAGAFQQGHELRRGHAAAGGVVPAHQCFHAHDGAGHAVALGLQKEAELVIFQAVFQLAQQLALLLDPAEHGRRKAVHTAHGRAGVYRRDLRIAAQGLCVCVRMLGHRAHTKRQEGGNVLPVVVHAGLQLADDGQLLLLVIRQAEHKIVTAKVAHRRTGHLAVLQQKGGKGQHQVARLRSTVQLGIQFEMLEIDGGNTPVLALVLRQKLLQLLQEVVFASDPCKRIGLRCADIFIQLQFFGHCKSLAVRRFRQNMSFCKTV